MEGEDLKRIDSQYNFLLTNFLEKDITILINLNEIKL